MSIALERSKSGGGHRVELPEFDHRKMTYASSIFSSTEFSSADRGFAVSQQVGSDDLSGSSSYSSTSSIGKNSDEASGGDGGDEGEEVQSEYKGGPLDSLDALEEVLPVKKSISKFYNGKSKSFTSLSAAASCSSIEEITKPEDAYSRKRKNLLAFNNFWDKNRNNIVRTGIRGISKRPTNSRSMLTLAAMNSSDSNSGKTSISNSPSHGCCLPPRPPHARRAMHFELPLPVHADNFSSGRSFSLSDLQGAAAAAEAESASPTVNGLWTMENEE